MALKLNGTFWGRTNTEYVTPYLASIAILYSIQAVAFLKAAIALVTAVVLCWNCEGPPTWRSRHTDKVVAGSHLRLWRVMSSCKGHFHYRCPMNYPCYSWRLSLVTKSSTEYFKSWREAGRNRMQDVLIPNWCGRTFPVSIERLWMTNYWSKNGDIWKL